MKTNKEIIDALQEYYLKQDPDVIARALAALMIDLNRIMCSESLPKDEKNNLIIRMNANRNELLKFINEGEPYDFKIYNIES